MNFKNFFAFLIILALIVSSVFLPFSFYAKITDSKDEYMTRNINLVGGELTTGFDASQNNYSAYFKKFNENIDVNVTLNNPRFAYKIDGNKLLKKDNNNKIYVTVTDPKGEYKTEKFTFNIFFSYTGLSNLTCSKGILSPQFSKFHSTYYIVLENNTKTFEEAGIKYKTVNDDAVVKVICKDELNKDGTLVEKLSTLTHRL